MFFFYLYSIKSFTIHLCLQCYLSYLPYGNTTRFFKKQNQLNGHKKNNKSFFYYNKNSL